MVLLQNDVAEIWNISTGNYLNFFYNLFFQNDLQLMVAIHLNT